MQFTPKTEEELMSGMARVKEGKVNFVVKEAEDAVSKAGNEMIKVNLQVWDEEGTSSYMYDFLVSNVQWKLKRFCEAIDKMDLYESGNITPQSILDKAGICKVYWRKHNDKEYLSVSEYIRKGHDQKKDDKKQEDDMIDDDLPF